MHTHYGNGNPSQWLCAQADRQHLEAENERLIGETERLAQDILALRSQPRVAMDLDRLAVLGHVFAAFDTDGSGAVEAKELLQLGELRQQLGQVGRSWSPQKNLRLIQKMDKDESGCVEQHEFIRHFQAAMEENGDEEFMASMLDFTLGAVQVLSTTRRRLDTQNTLKTEKQHPEPVDVGSHKAEIMRLQAENTQLLDQAKVLQEAVSRLQTESEALAEENAHVMAENSDLMADHEKLIVEQQKLVFDSERLHAENSLMEMEVLQKDAEVRHLHAV